MVKQTCCIGLKEEIIVDEWLHIFLLYILEGYHRIKR
jgi:hypothetical protein